MKNLSFLLVVVILCISGNFKASGQDNIILPPGYQVDTRIDNMGYWRKMAELNLVPVQPYVNIPAAINTGSRVFNSKGIMIDDSPDVPVTTEVSTQSENSIAVNPNNSAKILNSNNSTPQPSSGSLYGADYFVSSDEGNTFTGSKQGAGGPNSGDPAACINITGRQFIGFIDNQSGQSVSYSDDEGLTWTMKKVATGTIFNMLDKNHLWVDISPTSPFKGYLYDGWMVSSNISVSRSITNGTSWETPIKISTGTNAGSHNQGLNFKCGPDGEVYCIWSVYDNWPGDEKALGFSKSLDGGITWSPAIRILDNTKGIRTTGVTQNMRVNSFPSTGCDLSNGPDRGALYVTWANVGVPGVNTGQDVDVYLIKSIDEGVTWSTPKRINTDPAGTGKKHYFPWITVDQANGNISIVYYDNRNVSNSQLEVFMAYSTDGGNTFEDLKVSDVAFTPSPIPNMASSYMGDYLSIASYNGKVYPCWTDTRLGYCMTYVSPIDLLMPAPLVVYDQNYLNDSTFGNDNNMMDFGETELLGLKLKNDGTEDALSVSVTVSCESPYITMIDSTEFYGDFLIGQAKTILDSFKFEVSDSIPHGQQISFLVKAKDINDTVTISTFYLNSYAPAVTIMSINIDDAVGNNNGRLDPGESVTLHILTKNTGTFPAIDAVSELSSSNPFVQVLNPVQNIGTLQPGQSVIVDFNVTVHPVTPIGAATKFVNYTHSGPQFDIEEWLEKIGLIVEDWETGNFTKFAWQFSGDADWTIDTVHWEKIYSAKSGEIDNSKASELFINYNVMYDDSISFYRKISSDFTDKLFFYMDGSMIGQWSGNQQFRRYAYPVVAGPHTFKWVYQKDGALTAGADASWLDFIVFPPEYRTTVFAGENSTSCGNSPFELQGIAVSFDSLLWTTSGTGTFGDPTIINTVYNPSEADVTVGAVILTLTAWGNGGQPSSTSLTLTLQPDAEAFAGEDEAVCAVALTLASSSALNFSGLIWTTSGDGTFNNNTDLHPVYTLGIQDVLNGSTNLTLSVTPSSSACDIISDIVNYTFKPLPLFELIADTAICGDQNLILDATVQGAASYVWSTGATTPSITVDSSGTGFGIRTFNVTVTGENGCIYSDSVMVTIKNCLGIDDMKNLGLEVYPNPNAGTFTLRLNSPTRTTISFKVISAKGEMVYSENITFSGSVEKKINISNVAQGSYVIEFSDGSSKTYRKLVIQK